MLSSAIERLEYILNEVPEKLFAFSDTAAAEKIRPGKWSKKEIMGHLIDSAANNHQRFVRLQLHEKFGLWSYEQDEWVKLQRYNEMDWKDIVNFWLLYNRQLLSIMIHVKRNCLGHRGVFPDGTEQTMEFIMTDYVRHMEHHLKQTGIDV